jgi:hypothetical protein
VSSTIAAPSLNLTSREAGLPHIPLPPSAAPGISGLLVAYPETGRPLRELVEALLRGPSTLSQGYLTPYRPGSSGSATVPS